MTLSVPEAGHTIEEYHFDFGDGTQPQVGCWRRPRTATSPRWLRRRQVKDDLPHGRPGNRKCPMPAGNSPYCGGDRRLSRASS